MAKTRRAYTGASVETTTTSAIASSGTTTFTVSAATNWPYGSDPYHVVLSPGTASEEKVLVTRTGSGDTTINIASDSERGQDGTSAVSHDTGATVYPVFTAVDADEANELASMWEAKGDIISHGSSTFSRLAVGTNDYVLQADSTAASGLAWGQVATAGIAADAVDGTKIADDSIDSEHYVDGSIDTAHLADDAVTAAKIATGAVGADALEATAVTAATYGDADSVGQFTVDADGRLTAAANVDISIASDAVSDATDANTASKIVKRDASGNFSAGTITAALTGDVTGNVTGNVTGDVTGNVTGDVTGDVTGNASTSTTLATSRDFSITGDITASSVSFNGSGNVQLNASIDANTVGSSELANGAVGATQMATGIRIKTGSGTAGSTYSDDGYGYYTIAHGCGTTPTFAAVSCTAKQSAGSDTIASCVVVEITSTNIVFRLYEIDGASTTNNGGATVSSVYSTTIGVKWMALY